MYDRFAFAGLREVTGLPDGYQELTHRHDMHKHGSFEDVLDYLSSYYGAEWRSLYYNDATGDSAVDSRAVNGYQAIVNPQWVGTKPADLPPGVVDAVWHIPTTSYTLVEHHEALSPLIEAIERVDDDPAVFGSCRTRRDGGEVHIDLFFEGVDLDGLDDDVTLGLSTGNDYFGGTKMYVDAIAFLDSDTTDKRSGRVMRYLSDRKGRKHTGAAYEDVVNFYEVGVEQIRGSVTEIRDMIGTAMHHELPIREMPMTVESFYQHLGLPDRKPNEVATPAGARASSIVPPGEDPTAWHLYKAGMWAIEHHYESRDTSAFKQHVATVNRLLYDPSGAETAALSSVESDLLEAGEKPETELTEFAEDGVTVEDELDTVRTRAETISDGEEAFESLRERLEALLDDEGTETTDPDETAAETATVEASD